MNSSDTNGAAGTSTEADSVNNKNSEDVKLWTTTEVRRYLHVSAKTVFNLRQRGLPYINLGGAVRFNPQEVKNYLATHRRLATHGLRQKVKKGEL